MEISPTAQGPACLPVVQEHGTETIEPMLLGRDNVTSARESTVSVIIPCYNGARFVGTTIASALRQTHAPLEIIVVDDGSTDDSAAIARAYGHPVRVIQQTNQGESSARNVGIATAQGRYLAFLDADDLLDERALEVLLDAVRDVPDGVACMGCAQFSHDPAQPSAVHLPEVENFFPRIIQTNLNPPHSWLVPKEIVVRIGGFDSRVHWFEDWHFWCRVALSGARLVPIPYIGAYYRQHPASQLKTLEPANRARGHVFIMEELCRGLLARDDLLEQYGQELFWSSWAALHHARRTGVPWHELQVLGALLQDVARRGPAQVRQARFAQMVRIFGARFAESLRCWYWRDNPEGQEGVVVRE